MKRLPSTFAALLFSSIGASAQTKINYTDHVLPIFQNVCNNCHNPDKKKAGLDLTTYQAAMAGGESGAAVKPGNAAGSLLYKLSAHIDEPKMPPKGDKLSDADLKIINDWIAGFALETANSKPVVAQQNKVESVVVSLTRPDGPAPMPGDLPQEPFVKARALGAVTTLAASPWAPIVAVGAQKQVLLYNVETLEPLGMLDFPEGFPNVLRFSRNAKVLIAGGGLGGKLGKVVMWDVLTGERIGAVGNETDAVLAADLSADHQFVAIGGADKRVRIYQTKDGRATGLIKKHTEWVTAVTFSPDGKYLGTADRNGGIEIWETAAEPKPFNTLAGHKAAVSALAFMPGVLASGSEDGTIKLWNVKEGTETKSWTAHPGGVLWVDFAPDGRLVSCGRDKIAKVWDASGKALAATEAFKDIALRAAIYSDRVVAADWTGAIRVFAIQGDKTSKVGELSATPPGIAEQLAAAEKILAETKAAIPALQTTIATAEAAVKAERDAAEAKRKANLSANEARKSELQKQLDTAKAAPGNAEKKVADFAAAVDAGKQELAKAEAHFSESKKAAAANGKNKSAEVAVAAQKRVEELAAEIVKARETRSKFTEGTPEYTKADAAVQAIKPELAKAEQVLVEAKPKAAEIQPPAGEEANAAKLVRDEAHKKLESTRQQLLEARTALSKAKSTSPKTIAESEKAIASVNGEIAKLTSPPASAITDADKVLAKAKKDFADAENRATAAHSAIARWKRAQLYQSVHNARIALHSKQAKYNEVVAAAKDAFRQAELAKQTLAEMGKMTADAPKFISAKEAVLVEARNAAGAIQARIAAAEKAIAEHKAAAIEPKKIEAEIAELTNQQTALNAEVAKARAARDAAKEGAPEHSAAKAKREELRPKEAALTAALEGAKAKLAAKPASQPVPKEMIEAVKTATLEWKLANDRIPLAEKALADSKRSAEDALKQIPILKSRIPQLTAEGAKIKATAEQSALLLAKEIEVAKAGFEKSRTIYEASKAVQKSATAVPVNAPQS